MMKTKTIGAILILLLVLGFTACKPVTSLPDGTVTVNLSGAESINLDYLYAYVYVNGETDYNNPDTVLACEAGLIASGAAAIVLKIDNGAWEPTGVVWTGTGGVTYDIYIYTTDSDNSPSEDDGDKMTVPMPMEIMIDGNQIINVLFSEMTVYKDSGA